MTFQEALTEWYVKNHRDLPWRNTDDPYKIWLSEVMCQQTQVATVIDYYNRFISRFPTIFDLANAPEDDVYKMWEGLGYYSRANRLMLCAREVVAQYDGIIPSTYDGIIKLPGIGPYTAGAVLSIAYGVIVTAIDGNVMRVYARLYNLEYDVGTPQARKAFEPYVERDLPNNISAFNQGLMELGATICTPTNPKCSICPIITSCKAYKSGKVALLPIKKPKKRKLKKKMWVAYIRCEDKVMLEKRGTDGLLANMWGFPIFENTEEDIYIFEDWIAEVYGIVAQHGQSLVKGTHVFTHLIWEMEFIEFIIKEPKKIDNPYVEWVRRDQFIDYPLPTAFKKLAKQIK